MQKTQNDLVGVIKNMCKSVINKITLYTLHMYCTYPYVYKDTYMWGCGGVYIFLLIPSPFSYFFYSMDLRGEHS